MFKLMLLVMAISFDLAQAQVFQTRRMGPFLAPKSAIGRPSEPARERLYYEGYMTVGRFKGERMDYSQRSPPVILGGTLSTSEGVVTYDSQLLDGVVDLDEGEVAVAKIEHLGKFYIGVIDTKCVESLDMGYSIFMPIASHYLTFFNFSECGGKGGMRLLAELPSLEERKQGAMPKMLERPIVKDSMVLSIEATGTKGKADYSLIHGMQGWFANSFLITTVSSQLENYLLNNYPRRRYRASFTKEETTKILHEALHTADRAGNTIEYHTLLNNCTSLAMEIYERAVGYTQRSTTALGKVKRFTNYLLGTVLPLGKIYPLINEFTGGIIRDFRKHDSQLVNLEEDPKHQIELDQLRAKHGLEKIEPTAEHQAYRDMVKDATRKAVCSSLTVSITGDGP